jgi:hypothetical protein
MTQKEILPQIEYVVCCVGAFAERFNLSNSQAYAYLRRFSGIDFLLNCYAAEHTLSIDDAIADLQTVCLNNGGKLS